MDKLAIKVVLNPLTTPQLFAQLAAIGDARLRAEVLRRLAEFGAEYVRSLNAGAGFPPSSQAMFTAIAPPPSGRPLSPGGNDAGAPRMAEAPLEREGTSEQVAAASQPPAAPVPLTPPVDVSGHATTMMALDVDSLNNAMDRFF